MENRDESESNDGALRPPDPVHGGDAPVTPPPVVVGVAEYWAGSPSQAVHVVDRFGRWDAPPFPPMDQSPLRALVDLLAVVSLLVAFAVYSYETNLAERIGAWFPSVGALGWVFANGLVALAGVAFFVALRGRRLRSIGLCSSPWRRLLPVTLAAAPVAWATGIACNITYVVIQLLRGVNMEAMLHHRLTFINEISQIDMRWVAPLSIFVGIYEEIFFRGFVMGRLASITRSRIAAIVISSLMFGAVHFTQGWLGIFQTTCLGAVLAVAAMLGRSLWAAILAHAAIDGFSLAASVLMRSDIADMLNSLTTTQAGA